MSLSFINHRQWDVLKDTILPDLLSKNKRLKVWSAACSTGEEPYSLVMCLSNFMPLRDIETACDFDEAAMGKGQGWIIGKRHCKYLKFIQDTLKSLETGSSASVMK